MTENGVCGYEKAAMEATSPVAGKYLVTLGKFDLRTMTPKEWEAFIELICTTYHSEVNFTHIKALMRAATPTSDEMAERLKNTTFPKVPLGPIEDDEIPF